MHSRRQKGQQGARKGQQGVAPCYLHLAGPLRYMLLSRYNRYLFYLSISIFQYVLTPEGDTDGFRGAVLGLLGPDVSAHFSIWDCSAHFSGIARPIFYFFFGGGGEGNLLFYSVYVHQNKIQETLLNMIIIPALPYQRR